MLNFTIYLRDLTIYNFHIIGIVGRIFLPFMSVDFCIYHIVTYSSSRDFDFTDSQSCIVMIIPYTLPCLC